MISVDDRPADGAGDACPEPGRDEWAMQFGGICQVRDKIKVRDKIELRDKPQPPPAAPSGSAVAGSAAGRQAGWAKPLRLHLSVIIVLLLVATSTPLMWLTYSQGRSAALTAAEQQMTLLSRRTIELYETIFRDGHAVITMGAVLPSLAAEPPAFLDAKQDFLLRALKGSPHVDGIYIGYPSGSLVQMVSLDSRSRWAATLDPPVGTAFALRVMQRSAEGPAPSTWRFLYEDGVQIGERTTPPEALDPRKRPWYEAARGTTGPASVGPYISASTHSLTLTLATSMVRDRRVVLGTDVLVETLSRLLADEKVSEHGSGYVFDGGQLIVHSDNRIMQHILAGFDSDATVETASVADEDPVLAALPALLAAEGSGPARIVRFDVGDEPYLASIAPVGFSHLMQGERVVIAAPLDDFTGPSTRLLQKTLAIAGIFVLAGVLIALVVARLISIALMRLTADARQIGDLDFAGLAPSHSWIAEINMLATALGQARDAIRSFALYVPRELVRRVIASGQSTTAQAVRQEVTILFTDIQDFTTISERHPPEAVVDMLAIYFQRMNEIVERHNGVIVQYLGDSIYAMWNAPTADPDHVDDACRCTLALKAAIDAFNADQRRDGRPEFVTRFGLHTGTAVVGSVGAQSRRQYTAMGDTVNVASRLEGMNKQFGTSILASGVLRDRCRDDAVSFRSLGKAQAKGRHEEIEIFELAAGG